ncbi:MAG TPA: M20/M25/M40 family metallo-hydrolase [Terriglobales bacterium]|jgi:carboxypeptidase Q|nr:M20/M25/M40 family metallo-hydrolase [Terriglobales bacterium]
MFRKLVCLALPLFSLVMFAADNNSERLIQEALKPSPLASNLRHLTDEIGGRVPGTPAMQRAVDWGVAAFKAAGADSVHTEEFAIPYSWAEGATAMSASTYSGTTFPVRAVSIAWAPALAATKHVPVMDVGEGTKADFAKAGDVSGKLLLVHTKVLATWADLFGEYEQAPVVIALAVKGKAKAIAFMASRENDILYRHTNSVAGEIDQLPMVIVAREDGERIGRLLASANPVWADIAIPNHVGGPIKSWNVVAELRGSEKPEEFVILGAHLDSWELGTGALDNGCNAALVIDALRAIKASGMKRRRSIRFILFSGEEEGLIGSRMYAVAHRDELDRAAGVVIFDSGTGKTIGFSTGGRKDVAASAQALIAPLEQFGAAKLTPSAESGTDHFDFMLEGVPTFVADQDEANYLVNYHATSDTYDKVDFPQLKKNIAVAAVLSFELASTPEHIGPRIGRAQIDQSLREIHFDDEMKAMGMWDEWAHGKRGREK